MAISSINIQPSSGNATIHNERIFDVAYALKSDDVNEYHRIASITQTRQAIYEDYKLHHGRKLNTKATPIREAVVNLNEHHTMKDLIKLSEMLESKYKMKVLHIAIHRDEGHIDKDGKEKINYHAHIVFSNYDFDKHITIKRDKQVMRELQTDVAKSLGMERGKENSNKQRLDHRQYKRAMQEVEEKTKDLKSELKEVKTENKTLKEEVYNFKEMQKKITQLEELNSSQKRELHQLNSQVKNNKAEFETLQKKIAAYEKTFKTIAPAATKPSEVIEKVAQLQKEKKTYKQSYTDLKKENEAQNKLIDNQKIYITQKEKEINTLKNQNKSLQEQKEVLPTKDITKEEKSVSRPNMELYQELKELQKDFNSSFEKKEYKKSMFSSEYLDTLKPVENKEESLLSKIKSRFNGLYEYMSNKIKEVENAYKSIIAEKDKRINNLVTDKVQLRKKVEHLEERVNKLEKEKTLSHTGKSLSQELEEEAKEYKKTDEYKKSNAMDKIKEMQNKAISKDDINKASQELRELNKYKGQELER